MLGMILKTRRKCLVWSCRLSLSRDDRSTDSRKSRRISFRQGTTLGEALDESRTVPLHESMPAHTLRQRLTDTTLRVKNPLPATDCSLVSPLSRAPSVLEHVLLLTLVQAHNARAAEMDT